MVDVTAAVLGTVLALVVVVTVIGGGSFYAYVLNTAGIVKDPLQEEKIKKAFDTVLSPIVCTFLILLCALIPIVFFSSGFVTDTIDQSWNYSNGAVVGLVSLIALMIFGSTKFADFSKSILGFLPSKPDFTIPDPSDATKTITNIWPIVKWLAVWIPLVIGIIILAPVISGLTGSKIAEGVTIPISVLLILVLVAGNGLLAKFTPEGAPMSGGSTFQIHPYPEGLCDVPGFGWAANQVAPASIVLTQTIAWYFMMRNFDTGNNSSAAALGGVSASVFALQWWALNLKGCLDSYTWKFWAPLVGYVLSIGLGAAGYEAVKSISVYTQSSKAGTPSGPKVKPTPGPNGPICTGGMVLDPDGYCVPKLGPGGTGPEIPISVGGQQKTSEPVDDQDAFVCEAYKDGELITSTIVE